MTAYYNDNNPAACHILRHMIELGVIAPGVVDERSIKDVTANDIRGATQCHFFAGGGFWSIAARMAGWPDDRSIWSASCPCQPWSNAGKRGGADDPRHLWPDLYRIIRSARDRGHGPSVIVGEQVSGTAGLHWFDGIRADLAQCQIACRMVDFPAGAVNAPHKRNRISFVALADCYNGDSASGRNTGSEESTRGTYRNDHSRFDLFGPLPMANGQGISGGRNESGRGQERRTIDGRPVAGHPNGPEFRSVPTGMDTGADVSMGHCERSGWKGQFRHDGRSGRSPIGTSSAGSTSAADGAVNYWHDAEWIICHDQKARRTKPGICFLVDGLPGRVDLWSIAGNAIVPQAQAEVIAALMDVLDGC